MAGIEILIETWQIEERIEGMLDKIKNVPAPQEFIAWQAEDMNRKRPSAEASGPTSMFTMIYPRARRLGAFRSVQPRRKIRRGKAQRGTKPVGGKRPILRPVLFERLCERMRDMMGRELKW